MSRASQLQRETKETKVEVSLVVDGGGTTDITTGIPFFDHMLDQLARRPELWCESPRIWLVQT
jgi:imidazoleglycerol phosphate dehydratase HisB